jgi:hypothetical protein
VTLAPAWGNIQAFTKIQGTNYNEPILAIINSILNMFFIRSLVMFQIQSGSCAYCIAHNSICLGPKPAQLFLRNVVFVL